MRKILMLAVVMVAAVSMIACATKKSDASVFEGKKVVLTSFAEGELVPVEIQSPAVLVFNKEEGRINGSSACNRLFGEYKIEGDKITFSKVGSTRMMCDPVSNDVEMKMLELINTANRFETTEASVIFFKDDVRLGEFSVPATCSGVRTSCPEAKTCEKTCASEKKAKCCDSKEGVCKETGKACCSVDSTAKCCSETAK